MKANVIIGLCLIAIDWFIGLELKSFAIGVLAVLLYEPLKENLKS